MYASIYEKALFLTEEKGHVTDHRVEEYRAGGDWPRF